MDRDNSFDRVGPIETAERTRPAWCAPLGAALAALGLYGWTLAPTVTAEDSGELIAAAHTFGIPHPPGYPLWTALCGAFLRATPWGSIAVRANLFSALCGAAACAMLCAALRELSIRPAICFAAAVSVAVTASVWRQSVITEVYTLNLVLTVGLLWCGLHWARTRSRRPLLLAALLTGLGLSNHPQIGLAALALLGWMLVEDRSLLRRGRLMLAAVALLAVGLLPYAYLPLRAAASPAVNWGDPSTPAAFWQHITRASYGGSSVDTSQAVRSLGRWAEQLAYIAEAVAEDLSPIGLALGLVGWGWLTVRREHRGWSLLIALWAVFHTAVFALLANFGLDAGSRWNTRVYLIPLAPALVIGPAIMANDLLRRVRAATRLAAIPALAPLLLAAYNFRTCDYSNYWFAFDHARNMLDAAAANAMIIARGDHNVFPLVYLTVVERCRPDVVLARKAGGLDRSLLKDRPADSPLSPEHWLIVNHSGPVYDTLREGSPPPDRRLIPSGMLFEVVSADAPARFSGRWDRARYRNLLDPTARDYRSDCIVAAYYLFGGLEAAAQDRVDLARERLLVAGARAGGNKELLNNVGVALGEAGETELALRFLYDAKAIDPAYLLPQWNLVSLHQARGESDTALRVIREILSVDPDNELAQRVLGRLSR